MVVTYEESGIHNDAKEEVSKILYNAAKQTWENRAGKLGEIIMPFDDFSGVRAIDVSNLPRGTLMNMGFDGTGSKVKIAQLMNNHRTIAYDLVAMVCDDAVVRGAEPILLGSILDVNSLKAKDGREFREQIRQLAEGYVNAAREANVAIVNGETAELGDCIGGIGEFNYNWGASIVWFAKKERLFTGREICVGDSLVGFVEDGFRSNGISLLRRIVERKYGPNWISKKIDDSDLTLGELALLPSKIYTRAVVAMFGGYANNPRVELHGVSHITGGGVPEKLGRMLRPSGFGADLTYLCPPSNVMKFIQKIGDVSDVEAYKTWNMGPGMIVATPNPTGVMEIASEYGIGSQIVGEVTKKPGIRIHSMGAFSLGKILEF